MSSLLSFRKDICKFPIVIVNESYWFSFLTLHKKNEVCRKHRIWSHLLNKSLLENLHCKKKLFMPLMSAILTKKQNSVSNKVKLTVHSRGLPFLSASYFLYNSTFQFQFQYHKRTRYDSSNKTLLVFNTQMKVFIKIRIKSFYLLPWGTILYIT